jgi:predicted transcriptional regulator
VTADVGAQSPAVRFAAVADRFQLLADRYRKLAAEAKDPSWRLSHTETADAQQRAADSAREAAEQTARVFALLATNLPEEV